ncbi:MAG: HEAT repeat domain-containing protein [Verrucomicrobiota bacterium]
MVALLSRLGKDADLAMPGMAAALKDEDQYVRQLAINYFTYSERNDANSRLTWMDKALKQELLPAFLAGLQENNEGTRNNALIALRYYPEEKSVVTAAVIPILKDPEAMVRIRAVETLHRVNPEATVAAGAVTEALKILNHPDDQIAHQGAAALGEMQKEPATVVPALIAAMNGTNSLVGSEATYALKKFPGQADIIIPALHAILQRTNSPVPRYNITGALKEFERLPSKTNLPE